MTALTALMHWQQDARQERISRHDLDEAIRTEHANGKTYRQLGAELGMSHQRIAQICKEDS